MAWPKLMLAERECGATLKMVSPTQVYGGAGGSMELVRRVVLMVAMLAVVGLLVWAGLYNFRSREQAMEKARESHITLTPDGSGGTASLGGGMPSDGLGKNLIGKQVPDFSLPTLDGKKVTLAQFKGKPLIVNFWATYCGPCRLEMPWFQEFSQKYAAQGLRVIGIDDEDGVTKQQVRDAAQKIGVTYPILLADSKVESQFGLGDYLPETYYVDAQGRVQVQTPGAPSKDEIEANIQKILSGSGAAAQAAPAAGAM